ncbi:hypothetical protein FRC03_007757 [Tulasnella sp. 419]|nr:hypothetical protein FRC03_007757 [Tulasnella sp. 419]
MDNHPFLQEHYQTLLSSAPNIAQLQINRYKSNVYPDPHFSDAVEIRLPSLKNLYLIDLPPRTINFLLSSISTASKCHPQIDIKGKLRGTIFSMFFRSSVPNSLLELILSCKVGRSGGKMV